MRISVCIWHGMICDGQRWRVSLFLRPKCLHTFVNNHGALNIPTLCSRNHYSANHYAKLPNTNSALLAHMSANNQPVAIYTQSKIYNAHQETYHAKLFTIIPIPWRWHFFFFFCKSTIIFSIVYIFNSFNSISFIVVIPMEKGWSNCVSYFFFFFIFAWNKYLNLEFNNNLEIVYCFKFWWIVFAFGNNRQIDVERRFLCGKKKKLKLIFG